MRRFVVLLLGGLWAAAASAQPAMQPKSGALPAGHPQIPGMLPAGHPEIPAPATQPAAHGTLVIRVKQGTANGPALKGDPVAVELYHQQRVIRKIDTVLDENGVVILDSLPLLLEFQPVVTVKHAGVNYPVIGRVMNTRQPSQQVEVTVYETTEEPVAWQVHMRHVMVEATPEGLHVVEMLAIENPTNLAWLGTKGADGTRRTVVLPLPDVHEVRVAGDRYEGCIRDEDGSIVDTMPLLPGVVQVQLHYSLPAKDGQVSLAAIAPAPVKNMILFAPDGGAVKKVEGLEATGTQETSKGVMQMYRGMNLAAGHKTVVSAVMPMAPIASGTSSAPKIIAAVGAGVILVVGAFIVVLKTPKKN